MKISVSYGHDVTVVSRNLTHSKASATQYNCEKQMNTFMKVTIGKRTQKAKEVLISITMSCIGSVDQGLTLCVHVFPIRRKLPDVKTQWSVMGKIGQGVQVHIF